LNPKTQLLIISNEPLSNSTSNGRTLRNLLLNIPKEQKAQFYIHGEPDEEACSTFYKVSDRDALNAFLFKKAVKKAKSSVVHSTSTTPSAEPKKIRKSCKTMVLRDIVWRSNRWWNKDFKKFVEDFAPDVVLLQAGDSPFMYAITLKIARMYNIPIVMYNSEEYVLKEKIYNGVDKKSIWHKLLQSRLKRIYMKFMQKASYCIYSTEYLEDKYQNKYPHPGKSCALYTVSELEPLDDKSDRNHFSFLYCGNLGVGRVYPLDEIAKVLLEIDKSATLDIYGEFTDSKSEEKLCSNSNVRYGGVVPYDEVPALMSKASMLLHCENPKRIEDLRGAFSTKIADSLASGKPFLVYATREYPFVQYLAKYDCAHIAADSEELKAVLEKCIEDLEYRNQYIGAACDIAKKNHNAEENCSRVLEIFNSILGE